MASQTREAKINPEEGQSLGLVLLDRRFRVLGMSARALEILGVRAEALGKSVFDYHPTASRAKITEFLRMASQARSRAPLAMIIDVLGKVITIGLAPLTMAEGGEAHLVATIKDVTVDTGAVVEPTSGQVRLAKFPVCLDGGFCFLDNASIYYFRADGNYCRIFTERGSHHVLMTLKHALERCAGPQFFRVHKSFVANLDRMGELRLKPGGQGEIIFDSPRVKPVPVARRRLAELRRHLGL